MFKNMKYHTDPNLLNCSVCFRLYLKNAFCTHTQTVHIHLIFSGLKCILWCHTQAPPLHASPRPLWRLRPLFGFCGRMAENHWTWAIQRKLQHSRILQLRERPTHESRVSITLTLHTQLHILMSLKMTLADQNSLFYRDLAKMGISCSAHQRKILSSMQESGMHHRQDTKIPVWSVTRKKNNASCCLTWITRGTEYFTLAL